MFYRNLNEPLLEKLHQFSNIILDKKDEFIKIRSSQIELKSLSPDTALKIFNNVASSDFSIEICKKNIDKITTVFYKPLLSYESGNITDHFLKLLSNENKDMLKSLSFLKKYLQQCHSLNKNDLSKKILPLTRHLEKYKSHYNKQERYLFPIFNKVMPQYFSYINISKQCHNDFRNLLLALRNTDNNLDKEYTNKILGDIYFRVLFSVYREELVFFPMCQQFIHYDLKKYLYE